MHAENPAGEVGETSSIRPRQSRITGVELLGRYSKMPPPPAVRSAGCRPDRSAQRPIHAVRKRLSPETVQRLTAHYEAGRSTSWLMANYSLGKGTVLSILEQHNVKMRGQGIPEAQVEDVIRLYRSGHSLMQLSKQLDCSAETVRQVLLGAGITPRKPWERGPLS